MNCALMRQQADKVHIVLAHARSGGSQLFPTTCTRSYVLQGWCYLRRIGSPGREPL